MHQDSRNQNIKVSKFCKFINVYEGFIWRILRPSLNRKNKYPANIIHVPRQLTRPKLTANINPHEHVFISKMQTLIPANMRTLMNLQYLSVFPLIAGF